MNFSLKSIVIAVIVSFSPLIVCAAESESQSAESFQTTCVNTWMNRVNEAKDKVDYKDFGEKYCECAATQPLDSDEAVNKAIQLCMSQTLLHDTMDSLEEEIGLSEATEDDVSEYCLDRWNLVYPKLSENGKRATQAYCECAKPKLMGLIKEADNMTDKQYADEINSIAAACSPQVKSDKAASNTSEE